jgi:hypothetical protein
MDNDRTAVATLSDASQRHAFDLALQAGHRYRLTLDAAAGDPWSAVSIDVHAEDAAPGPNDGLFLSGPAPLGLDGLFSPTRSGPYTLVVAGSPSTPIEYRLQLVEIGPDDHADTALGATPLTPAHPALGRLEQTGDVDAFAVDLQAGQTYRFDAQGIGDDALAGAELRLVGDDGSLAWSQHSLIFSPASDGRYTLLLGAPAGNWGDYGLQLTELGAATDRAPPATLNPGDGLAWTVDDGTWQQELQLDLQAGERVELRLRSDGTTPGWFSLWSADPDGSEPVAASARPGQVATMWITAGSAGLHPVWVDGNGGATGFELSSRRVPLDDHSDRLDAATPLQPGQAVNGRIDAVWDVDCFVTTLQAGQRYRIAVDGSDTSFEPQLWALPAQAARAPWLGVASGGSSALTLVPETTGPVTLRLQATQAQDYRLSVQAVPDDDHADVPGGATRVLVDTTVTGTLEALADTDCFRFDAQPMGRYRCSVTWQGEGRGQQASLWPVDADGNRLEAWGEQLEQTLVMHLATPSGGPIILPLSSAGPAQAYTLRIETESAADNQLALGPPTSMGSLEVQHDLAQGRSMVGTPGPDRLLGTPFDDHLSGGAGDDRFEPGTGRDALRGGTGFDTVWFDGPRGAYTAGPSSEGAWVVAGPESSDLLVDIERVAFADGAGLAIDFDGAAGVVRRLETLIFGSVAAPGFEAQALARLESNTDIAALAAWMLQSNWFYIHPTVSPNEWLLHTVQQHVPALLADEDELQAWLQRLDSGEITAPAALALACDAAPTRVQVELIGLYGFPIELPAPG